MNQQSTRKVAAILAIGLFVFAHLTAGTAFFGDPPDAHHPWAVHDRNRPLPERVEPAARIGDPPSDAIVLFDGTEASFRENWRHVSQPDRRKADWTVQDGYMLVVPGAGSIETIQMFGDCQLHVEWSHEHALPGLGQGRGNSGVFLPGGVEVQILDNYNNPTYADGTAGAVYGVMPPAVNALRPPGQWQSYDIIYRRPIVKDGEVIDTGSLTVLMNGVVVQDATPLEGGGGWRKRQPYNREFPELGALSFQDHGDPVRFRNVWYRPLRPRPSQGGFDGRISTGAAMTKRAEIAAQLRQEAAGDSGVERMLLLLESIYYKTDASALEEAEQLAQAYLQELQSASDETLKTRKGQVRKVYQALRYMQHFGYLPDGYAVISELESLMASPGLNMEAFLRNFRVR